MIQNKLNKLIIFAPFKVKFLRKLIVLPIITSVAIYVAYVLISIFLSKSLLKFLFNDY